MRRDRQSALLAWLRPWPLDRPRNWLAQVNEVMDEEDLHDLRQSSARGVPLGQEAWKTRVAHRLGLDNNLRPRGRPRKTVENSS